MEVNDDVSTKELASAKIHEYSINTLENIEDGGNTLYLCYHCYQNCLKKLFITKHRNILTKTIFYTNTNQDFDENIPQTLVCLY